MRSGWRNAAAQLEEAVGLETSADDVIVVPGDGIGQLGRDLAAKPDDRHRLQGDMSPHLLRSLDCKKRRSARRGWFVGEGIAVGDQMLVEGLGDRWAPGFNRGRQLASGCQGGRVGLAARAEYCKWDRSGVSKCDRATPLPSCPNERTQHGLGKRPRLEEVCKRHGHPRQAGLDSPEAAFAGAMVNGG